MPSLPFFLECGLNARFAKRCWQMPKVWEATRKPTLEISSVLSDVGNLCCFPNMRWFTLDCDQGGQTFARLPNQDMLERSPSFANCVIRYMARLLFMIQQMYKIQIYTWETKTRWLTLPIYTDLYSVLGPICSRLLIFRGGSVIYILFMFHHGHHHILSHLYHIFQIHDSEFFSCDWFSISWREISMSIWWCCYRVLVWCSYTP